MEPEMSDEPKLTAERALELATYLERVNGSPGDAEAAMYLRAFAEQQATIEHLMEEQLQRDRDSTSPRDRIRNSYPPPTPQELERLANHYPQIHADNNCWCTGGAPAICGECMRAGCGSDKRGTPCRISIKLPGFKND
jgi:hypothetical protein